MIFFCWGPLIFRVHFDMLVIFLEFYRFKALLLLFLAFPLHFLMYGLIDSPWCAIARDNQFGSRFLYIEHFGSALDGLSLFLDHIYQLKPSLSLYGAYLICCPAILSFLDGGLDFHGLFILKLLYENTCGNCRFDLFEGVAFFVKGDRRRSSSMGFFEAWDWLNSLGPFQVPLFKLNNILLPIVKTYYLSKLEGFYAYLPRIPFSWRS